jgi:hypothetical protein
MIDGAEGGGTPARAHACVGAVGPIATLQLLMSRLSIFCLATSRGRADRIIHDLKDAEFSSTDLSVLLLDANAEGDHAGRGDSRMLTSAAARSAGPIRGGLAWVTGVGRLMIPGAGSFLAAGPIIAALHRACNVAPADAVARGLIHLGVSVAEATPMAQRITADGHLLISVHSTNPDQILRAREIFTVANAQNICTAADDGASPVVSAA